MNLHDTCLNRRSLLWSLAATSIAATRATANPAPSTMRLAPDRELMVPVEGGRIYVRVNGDLNGARLPLVYMHGGPGGNHAEYLPLTALADERAIILYDQLDSGRSEAPEDPKNWRVARFVDELEEVRKALGVSRWHVGGGSWGGTLAIEYGARRPKELASLIVQSPLVSTRQWLEDAALLRDQLPNQWRTTLLACEGAAPPNAIQCQAADDIYYRAYLFRTEEDPKVTAYKKAQPSHAGMKIYQQMWGPNEFRATGLLKDYDGEALLEQLDGKHSLFVAGEFDEARPQTIKAYAKRVKGASFSVIKGAAHDIMTDAPDDYLSLLRTWCRQYDAIG